ncbi:hypothetical protein MHK_002047 [Candidatus Magnetomorum sp. HK-1]|nr:hypothetical protein MHK_002047 [Candidatus Magnetomorum sp. HK-1]
MMTGEILIKRCSECSGLIKEHTIMSGNAIGATFWTDGKCDAEMLPDQPSAIKCPYCKKFLWIEDLKIIENGMTLKNEQVYDEAKDYLSPQFSDFATELKKNTLTKDQKIYLRIRSWRAGNDPRRITKNKTALSDAEKENLIKLEKLLDLSNDNDRIMIAEIKRELGLFEDAEKMLSEPFEEQYLQAVSIIKGLIQKRDPFVTTMFLHP